MKTYYKIGGEEVFLTTGIYMFTGNTALNATCSNGEAYGCLTVNLPDIKLESYDLAFLNINLNVDVEKFITENKLGRKLLGREVKSGYLTYPLYRLNLEKIYREFNKKENTDENDCSF